MNKNWKEAGEELLENRHVWKVVWDTPWPGLGPEDNELDCYVTNEMTVHDAINFQRATTKDRGFGIVNDDLHLIYDFIVIHWAEVKKT